MQFVTLADRPDLAEAAFSVPYADDDGAFMQGDMAALLTRSTRLATRWPRHTLVAIADGDVIGRAVSVPYARRRDGRADYPDGGWDQLSIWAAEDALDGVPCDAVGALEIAIHPELRGSGAAGLALAALRRHATDLGATRIVAPVRPPGKCAEPLVPMDEYARRRRPDGELSDWWLRTHERAGGRLIGVARCSGTVQAGLEHRRRWTSVAFDHDIGVYVEPNVWFDHTI